MRLKSGSPSEHDEQAALFRWLEANSGKHPYFKLAFAIPNGGARNLFVAKKLKAEGVKRGVPDIFIPCPTKLNKQDEHTCHGFWIEMKSKKGRISPEQEYWAHKLTNLGYAYLIFYSWQEAALKICEYFDIDPKTCGLK